MPAYQRGDRIGPYEVVNHAGEGGMGVVYQARDTRLNRMVAIKVLPPSREAHEVQRQRFLREAQAASALNHPNIVTIYDIGEADGADYIAMEFVEGKTLNSFLRREGMSFGELLRYGVQIADALSKAHAAGIVHRDLKPGNIMVGNGDQVKILDFGLAKWNDTSPSPEGDVTQSLDPITAEGTVVGTAAYMSPEQAQGKSVDARSDLFSLGSILYEMATGKRAFQGENQMSTISAVISLEPKPVSELRPEIPAELNRVIARCLRKDLGRRMQTAADLRIALDEIREETATGKQVAAKQQSSRGKWMYWAAGAAVVAVAAGLAFYKRGPAVETGPLQISPFTSFEGSERMPAWSPDGNQIAFLWSGEKSSGALNVYVKSLGENKLLRITNSEFEELCPAWSPDGRSIAFYRITAGRRWGIYVAPATGGAERLIGDTNDRITSRLTWTPDGKGILSHLPMPGSANTGIALFPLDGSPVRWVTNPTEANTSHANPAVSRDGKHIAFIQTASGSGIGVNLLMLQDLDVSFQAVGKARKLDTGNLALDGVQWSADDSEIFYWAGGLSVRRSMFRVGVDGSGPGRIVPLQVKAVGSISLSPKGDKLVVEEIIQNSNIWRVDLRDRQKAPEKLIGSSSREVFPQYSPDGNQIAFYSGRSGLPQIMVAEADGSGHTQLTNIEAINNGTPRWSADGLSLTFDSNASGVFQIFRVGVGGGAPQRLSDGSSASITASSSRDGQWVYFAKIDGGLFNVWKMPVGGGAAQQVTRNGGTAPVESPDGKTLYFVKDNNGVWKRPVDGGEEIRVVPRLYRYSYAPTNKGLYYTVGEVRDSVSAIEFLDFATGQVKTVAPIKTPDLGLDVSPDGRYLVFAQRDAQGSDLYLVEKFR